VEGEPPFGQAANPIALLYRIANDPVPPPRQAGALTDTLARLLRSDPGRRPTAREAEHELAGVTQAAAAAALPPDPPDQAVVAAKPRPAGRGRRRAIVAALVLGVVAITSVLIAIMTAGKPNTTATPPPTTTTRAAVPPPAVTTTAPHRTTTPATTSPPATTAPQNLGDQLTNAIVSYYQLVPGDLTQAWTRMTPDYQQNHAGGLSGYRSFWQPVGHVTVSNVTATPPDTVVATINYVYRDGHVVTERTRFGLVQQGGIWKIASSSVLSHQG
jgi:hypothetical protein